MAQNIYNLKVPIFSKNIQQNIIDIKIKDKIRANKNPLVKVNNMAIKSKLKSHLQIPANNQ